MTYWRRLLMGLLAIQAWGLTGRQSKAPPPLSVGGRVWYRKEPLAGGVIVFVPDEERGSSGPLIKGTIQPDGTFNLATQAPPGWYRVAVAPLPSSGNSLPTVADPYPVVPARFRNPQHSGLEGQVKAATDNVFEFHLDD